MLYTSKRNDRIGMQLYSMIHTKYYSQQQQRSTYIHTPLSKEYDQLFCIGNKNIKIYEVDNNAKIKNLGWRYTLMNIKKRKIDYKTHSFRKYRKKLINKYKKSKLYKNVFITNTINICIHCRQGDVAKSYNSNYTNIELRRIISHKLRYTPTSYINNVICILNKYMKGLPLNIHIHSDTYLDLDKIIKYKHNFKIYKNFDDSEYDAINSMIQADILFRYGISAFSGICAFYNSNIVISEVTSEYKQLYNYNNVYKFSECDNILENAAIEYSKMNIKKSL